MLLELGAFRDGREWRQVHFVREFRFPAEVQAAMTAPVITTATTTTNIITSAPKATITALLIIMLLLILLILLIIILHRLSNWAPASHVAIADVKWAQQDHVG